LASGRPNVLLLTVDTLRADRLSVHGYDRPTTPVLDKFAQDAIVCENAFTLGPFTQVACIQLFTSSQPFSYGGYDHGAVGRPDTVFKYFHDAGYYTWGLSTIHWVSPYYGYTGGLDVELGVFHLNTLVGMAVMNMRDTLRLYRENTLSVDEMLNTAAPVIRRLFQNVETYCDMFSARESEYRRDFPNAKIVSDSYDYSKVRRVVERHRSIFEKDPLSYIHTHLKKTPDGHEWLSRGWRYCRTPDKLAREAVFQLSNRFLRIFSPRLAGERASLFRYAVDAHAIAEKVTGHLRNIPSDKPFFLWAHFKDTHQPFVSGSGLNWRKQTAEYLESLGHPRDIDPSMVFRGRPKSPQEWIDTSALYDAAILSTDTAIGRILNTVDELGLLDNTVVGICGDHGEEIGEHGDYGHQCMFYEHNSRIPMMFRDVNGKGSGMRINSLVSSLDWSPTIAHMAGLDGVPGWVGEPVTSKAVAGRNHILMETFCRGNCVFEHRPLYMGIRTNKHKYIWKEYLDPEHTYGTPGQELYDLGEDPGEQENLYHPNHPLVPQFNALIARRMVEIPEITDQRIIDCFGDIGRDAVAKGNKEPLAVGK